VAGALQIRAAIVSIATLLISVLQATLTVAAEDDGNWRVLLGQQLKSQYGCEIKRFVFERQVPLDAETRREGRIECADGREIDYAQPNLLLKFELRLCGPTVC